MTISDLSRWRGRVAVVTGASSGIGAQVARDLCRAGVEVVAVARRRERLVSMRDELAGEGAEGKLHVEAVDLRDDKALVELFARVRTEHGKVQALINSAGLGHESPLLTGTTDRWREMLEVNVLALCVCTREALATLEDDDEGHVIHISSMAAHRIPPETGVYSATKYAVRSLTEVLRQELWVAERPVRVTSISPAFVETEFAEKYHRSADAAVETYGQYRVLQSEDVSNAVLYALGQPPEVQVHDLLLRPLRQQT